MAKEKINYYRTDNIDKTKAQYRIIYGERANGKSYAVKEKLLQEAYKNKSGQPVFGLVRRLDSDTKTELIESYFADMNKAVFKITKGEYNYISVFRRRIYFANIDEELKITRGQCIGVVFALALDERYKSTEYPEIKYVVYEEFVTKRLYLKDEVSRFMNLCSTIFRRREGVVYMIANSISRINPFFYEWALKNVPKQEQGTIDTYEYNTMTGDKVLIAVEYCGNTGSKASGMFFGRLEKSINGGHWETDEYPHLPKPLEEYNKIYDLQLQYQDFIFNIWLIVEDMTQLLYVYPARRKGSSRRLITEEFSDNFFTTNCLMNNKAENLISKLWQQQKVVYANNLTGEDFTHSIKNMKVAPFSII